MKLKNILVAIVVSIFSLGSFAFTSPSDRVQITKELRPFQVLTIQDDINVILIEGDAPAITIEGSRKEVSSVKIEEHGEQLVIRKRDLSSAKSKVFIYVTVKHLRSLEVLNNARVFSSGPLQGDLLWVKLAGNGEVNIGADAKKVLATSWANGKISVHGNYCTSSTFRSDSGRLVTSYSKVCNTGAEPTEVDQ